MRHYYFISYNAYLDGRQAFGNTSVSFELLPTKQDLDEAVISALPDYEVTKVCILGFTKFDSEEHYNYFYTKRPDNEDVTDSK